MSGYRGGVFKCPFYSRDYRDYLNCEGAQVKLPKEELDEYTRRYCANEEWRHCPIARALLLHYEISTKCMHAATAKTTSSASVCVTTLRTASRKPPGMPLRARGSARNTKNVK